MELKNKKINFLGDSITEGVGVSSSDKTYHSVLKEAAGLREAKNYGISGTRYARQQVIKDEYVDTNSFCERFLKMDDDADIVVVFGATNDYGHGDAPLGKFTDRTPDTFYGACHYLFSGLIRKYLGKTIVIMTPTHRPGEENITAHSNLFAFINAIREVAEYYALPLLDLYATSGIQPEIKEIREAYIPDGVHLNDEGHKIIADKLKKFLELL